MNQIIDDSHTKSLFQEISTQLEALLVKYKNQYPKNIGQIFRRDMAINTFVLCIYIGLGCYLSGNKTAILFAMFAVPGFIIFATALFAVDNRNKKDNRHYVTEIEQLRSQLVPLTIYPDVKNYNSSFRQRVENVTKYKAQIKRTYNWSFFVCLGIVALIFIKLGSVGLFKAMYDEYSENSDYEAEVLTERTVCELSPLVKDDAYVQKNLTIEVGNDEQYMETYGLSSLVPADSSLYALFITDTIGNPVPRAPVFLFNTLDGSYKEARTRTNGPFEQIRVRKYLKDNEQNLRYKVERLPLLGL